MHHFEIAEKLNANGLNEVAGLFAKNPMLWQYAGILLGDKRMRVRLGATTVIEEIYRDIPEIKTIVLPLLLPLLENPNHLVRGDAANLIANLGGKEYFNVLKNLVHDPDPQVRQVILDILEDLEKEK